VARTKPCSALDALEVSIKVLVRTDHQELDVVFVQDPISNQAHLVGHTELVDLDINEVTDLGLANAGIFRDDPPLLLRRDRRSAGDEVS
jgi:hypothetical protein